MSTAKNYSFSTESNCSYLDSETCNMQRSPALKKQTISFPQEVLSPQCAKRKFLAMLMAIMETRETSNVEIRLATTSHNDSDDRGNAVANTSRNFIRAARN